MSLLEVLSAVFGLVAVYFTANKSVWGWPFGIINVFLFGLLYYRNCLFANMWLQLMFLALSIYGWIVWVRSGTSQGKVETIRSSSRKELFFFALLAAALLPAIYFLLSNYTSGLSRQQIFLDALTTSMSIVAQYM
ncbi:MAG: nicotinamide riboside transporter PnuC, partial [Cytophagaceae bacterium]